MRQHLSHRHTIHHSLSRGAQAPFQLVEWDPVYKYTHKTVPAVLDESPKRNTSNLSNINKPAIVPTVLVLLCIYQANYTRVTASRTNQTVSPQSSQTPASNLLLIEKGRREISTHAESREGILKLASGKSFFVNRTNLNS